jgi:cyclophilin family peptidyl-prolyl cis-trans isomerase
MDGQFTIFGKVIAGFEAVNKLRAGDKILNLTVFVRTSGGR